MLVVLREPPSSDDPIDDDDGDRLFSSWSRRASLLPVNAALQFEKVWQSEEMVDLQECN